MRRTKPAPARNKIDVNDPMQIRIWVKRLGTTADDLERAVRKVGNSIASVSKEIDLREAARRTPSLAPQIDPAPLPGAETTATEVQLAAVGGN